LDFMANINVDCWISKKVVKNTSSTQTSMPTFLAISYFYHFQMFIETFLFISLKPILWVHHTQIVHNPMNRNLPCSFATRHSTCPYQSSNTNTLTPSINKIA
jgi:hypothetical protein